MMRKTVVFVAAFLALSVSALAQDSKPSCSLSVSPPSVALPLPISATVSCTDPGNDISQVTVDWGDGSAPFITTLTSFTTSHTYSAPATYTVTATANDLLGNVSDPAKQNVMVTPNQPPTCNLNVNPNHGQVPLSVIATATCSDPENDITSQTLDWGDGTSPTPVTSGVTTYAHTYNTQGTFTVTLVATDSAGNTGSAKPVSVKANAPPNAPPTCALAVVPTTGAVPLTVTATPSCTDPENDITSENLTWGDGTSVAVTNGTPFTHSYTSAGSFTVTLTATDIANNTGTATQTVTVIGGPAASVPTCTMTATPTSGTAPLAVSVNAACSDPRNDITSVVTSFGDGYYLVGSSPSHTYVNGGTYSVTVVANDKVGNTSKPVTQSITVSDNPMLFVGVSNGKISQFTKSGSNQGVLNSNQGGSMTGMAFDAAQDLYGTDFTADTVSKFDGSGQLMGTFGSGYNCQPESIVFDNSGNAFVGETGCSHALLKFDSYGNLQAAYSVAAEQEGSDWIDLAPDQCTIYYTSQGASVLRYNTCSKQQLAPFATGLNTGLAVKVLPDGGILVAEKTDVVRFDSAGRKIMTYNASGENCFVSLALDSDKASFWAADYCTSDLVRFDLGSGNEISKFNSGTSANTVFGVAERVAPPKLAVAGPLIPTPAQASIAAGQSTTITLNFTPSGAVSGQTFSFSCANLPANSSCSFSPATLQAGSSMASTQLTITTAGASARLARPPKNSPWMLALGLPWLGVILALPGEDGKRRRKRLVLMLLLVACLLLLLSCSGASGNSSATSPPSSPTAPPTPGTSTPSGTYLVVVHATSAGGSQSSTAVNLNVQ